jgi:integrase
MNWSFKMKYHTEVGFKEFSATEKQGTVIFLTEKELTDLYNYKFDNKRLDQVRDKYCFGCYTGLAFSDLDSLTHEHINNGTITKLRNKTKIPLNVTLPLMAIEILKRYQGKYKALPKISHQKFNEYIKECCKIAEINIPTIYKTFPKGIETENIAPKYELIGSHTARKTFITYLYHKTKNVILTAKIAGCSPDIIKKHYVGTDWEMETEAMKKAFNNN